MRFSLTATFSALGRHLAGLSSTLTRSCFSGPCRGTSPLAAYSRRSCGTAGPAAGNTLPHREPHRLHQWAFWLIVLMLLSLPRYGFSETTVGEYSLKSAFIYNFSKFVEWPETSFKTKKDFCIATLGRSPLDRELAALSGKVVQGRTIVFRKLSSPDEASLCQVVFISRSELSKIEGILDILRDLPVLTIAESDDFCKRGGMLSIEKENGKLVFDVNFRETQRSRLKPNSQLLKLARKIYGRP